MTARTRWLLLAAVATVARPAAADLKKGSLGGPTPPATIDGSGDLTKPPPDESGPAYTTDTDGDGVTDAYDRCPGYPNVFGAVPKASVARTAPECFLYTNWLKGSKYGWDPTTKSVGSWWLGNECIPQLAYPVDDVTVAGRRVRGVVVIGRHYNENNTLKFKPDQPWPKDGPVPRCLLSIDFARGAADAIGIPGGTLATMYVKWAGPSHANFVPDEGLGLVTSGPAPVYMRSPVGVPSDLERVAFSRGVVYGPAISGSTVLLYKPAPPDSSWVDPTKGSFKKVDHWTMDVVKVPFTGDSDISRVPLAPLNWWVLPTPVSEALDRDRTAASAASGSPYPPGFVDGLDGLPSSTLLKDDRAVLQRALLWPLPGYEVPPGSIPIPLTSRGQIFTPLKVERATAFTVVPAIVARQRQHYNTTGGTWFRPAFEAKYFRAAGEARMLAMQPFSVTRMLSNDVSEGDEPSPVGKATIAENTLRQVEVQLPGDTLPASTSESSPSFGHRWASNGGSVDCWADPPTASPHFIERAPFANVSADDEVSPDICPKRVTEWWYANNAARSQAWAEGQCTKGKVGIANVANGWSKMQIFGLAGGCGLVDTAPACVAYFGCKMASFGLSDCGLEDACVNGAAVKECGAKAVARIYQDEVPNDLHWSDVGDSFVPVVAMVRLGDHGVSSHMTYGDSVWNHAHQGVDWNWAIETSLTYDPDYRRFAYRYNSEHTAMQFEPRENELELAIPRGLWRLGGGGATDIQLHGLSAGATPLSGDAADGDNAPKQDWFGEVFGTDFCMEFGIGKYDTGPTTKPDVNASSFPGTSCGGFDFGSPHTVPAQTFALSAFRAHYGRGLFVPYTIGSFGTKSALTATDPDWPRSATDTLTGDLIGTGLEDYPGGFPHRMTFLGRTIVDCGHDPNIEIHPPHLLLMDVANPTTVTETGFVVAGFGFVNVTVPGHVEFDVWPPARPKESSTFVFDGPANRLAKPALGPGHASNSYGYSIDATGPQASGLAPQLACLPRPLHYPNHLHCAYEDPSGGPRLPKDDAKYGEGAAGDEKSRNARMTPFYVSSRFDFRFYVGWRN